MAQEPDRGGAAALEFALWPDNVEPLELFRALQTQWRVVAGFSGAMVTGLDYTALEAAMRMRRVKDRRALFDDIRAMEAAALPILNRRAGGD